MDTAATPADLGQELAWHEANQRVVVAALEVLRAHIERHLGQSDRVDEATQRCEQAKDALRRPSSLMVLQRLFGLSDFERDVVLLATHDQLDSDLAQLLPNGPSFNVALAALPGAHWSALTPVRPLRAVPLLLPLGDDVVHGRLRLDERILHFLVGIPYLDERLRGLCVPVAPSDDLPGSLEALTHELRAMWLPRSSPVQLVGDDSAAARTVIASACASAGLELHRLDARDLPTSVGERLALARLWSREAALLQSALLVEVPDGTAPEALHAALDVVQRIAFPAAIATARPLEDAEAVGLQRVDLPSPSVAERCRQLLRHCAVEEDEEVERAALDALGHFRLSYTASQLVGERVRAVLRHGASPGPAIWDACRRQVRARLGALARCLEPEATWDDLVLPSAQLELLRSLVAQVRQRDVVHRQWGFSRVGARGLGTMALFWGSSGTGKTLASEVIARELSVDLYHVDLSAVVSKYIGETEKNLSKIFDAAEAGGAVLLFDEADALFGKRSEVRDSHDRYANIEVSYLLQRMEAYRGLAILTSNIKDVMDSAFLRRIRMIVQFPFPDAQQREQLWRHMIPPGAPSGDLRFERLASLPLSGGEVRNIALSAAFAAAEAGQPLGMRHFVAAARIELAKTDRVLRGSEIAGWT